MAKSISKPNANLVCIPKEMGVDPFYRYKREYTRVAQLKNRQTQVTNITTISRQLERSVAAIKSYLQKALSTRINKDFVIAGVWSSDSIDNHIEDYIFRFVLCDVCGYPESQDGVCRACGNMFANE